LFLGTGNTVIKAVNVLKEHRVTEDNIILSNLFTTPIAVQTITTAFPLVCFLFYYFFKTFISFIVDSEYYQKVIEYTYLIVFIHY